MSEPDYGPGGYLPERAARRARKIILREQMGLGWPLAAVAAGLVLLVVGVVYVVSRTGPPGAPYVPVAPLSAVDAHEATVVSVAELDADVLVVRAGGGVQAFAVPAGTRPRYCPASRRLEDGSKVWNLTGRRVGGNAPSLQPVPSQVFEDTLYVSTERASWPALPSTSESGTEPACAG